MASAAKKFGLSFLFFCCAGIVAALPATPDPPPTTTLPVRTLRGYLMIVSVSINDCGPFDFLVDTGTNTTLLDVDLATELGLKPKDRLHLDSLASATNVPRYYLHMFRVGPASISNLEALAVPLPQLTALDSNIRGVLGMNFLLHFSFRLDFQHSAMELYPSPETARAPAGLRVPVEINESRLLIQVGSSASPRGSWKLALDSGISQFLVFAERIAPPSGADSCGSADCLMQVSTNLGDHTASVVVLNDVSVAETLLPATQVVVLRNDLQNPFDPQDGLLPAAPFHSVFFDRSNATIVFSPAPGAVAMAGLQ